MEADTVDISEYERLLDAKIDPLIETIKRLEKSQEKMVEIMLLQSKMTETLTHLQKNLDDHIQESNNIRNEIFGRLREIDKNSECKVIHKDLSDRIENISDKSDDKIWDVAKLAVAGVIGGLISWWIKK